MDKAVAALIVNYNAGDTLTRCVESVLSQGNVSRVVVVDNASADGSAQNLQGLFRRNERVTVLFNDDNPGFSAGVNRAAEAERESGASYLLVINPDCEMETGALRRLVDTLESRPEAALAAPAVVNRHGAVLRGTFRRFPDPWRSFLTFSGLWRLGRLFPALQGVEPQGDSPQETVEAEAVSGACMLIRKESFFDIGRMDEGYRLHCEDLDLMYRFEKAGLPRVYVPGARVYHEQGLSSSSRPGWVHLQKHRGMQRFFNKHQADRYGFLMRWLVRLGIWLRFLVTLPWVLIRR